MIGYLSRVWDIIVNHPQHPAVFLTKEIHYVEPVKEDQFRKFKGFLSFSADILTETLKEIKITLCRYGIDYNININNKENDQDIVTRKMSFF